MIVYIFFVQLAGFVEFEDGLFDFLVGFVNTVHDIGVVIHAKQPLGGAKIGPGVDIGRVFSWGVGTQ
jgi:hypothetical protein